MGKKKAAEGSPPPEEPKAEDNAKEEAPEDPPVVAELKKVDDEYLAIEREYERVVNELQQKYKARQAPLLEQRAKLLTSAEGVEGEAAKSGTPAQPGFWLQAMSNLPAFEDQIEEWDGPVLEYLRDVRRADLDPANPNKGFRLTFEFAENPYFTNTELWKEYHTEEASPYTGEINTQEVKCCEIDWNPGKNVTVEVTKKKAKGGGAKKAKKSKEKEEPRDSFFRSFFRHLHPEMPLPDDVNLEDAAHLCDDENDDEEMMSLLIENDYEIGCSVREQLIPFAVRWYTGEACPEDFMLGDDDEDGEEEDEEDEDDDDDDDDDDDEEDEPAPKKKGPGKARREGGGGGKKAAAGGGDKECKQQ